MEVVSEKEKKLLEAKLKERPFGQGMYAFLMFQIDYYSRVRNQLKLDYDTFIIVQVVTSHLLYILNKTSFEKKITYPDIQKAWSTISQEYNASLGSVSEFSRSAEYSNRVSSAKLTISSICLITNLPKETVRRKVELLCTKGILRISKKAGVLLGPSYKKVYSSFVPTSTFEVIKMIQKWEKTGVLKSLLNFR